MTASIVLTCVGFGALFRPLNGEDDDDKDPDDCESDDEEYDEEDRKGLLMEVSVQDQLDKKTAKLPVLMEMGNGSPAISPPPVRFMKKPSKMLKFLKY